MRFSDRLRRPKRAMSARRSMRRAAHPPRRGDAPRHGEAFGVIELPAKHHAQVEVEFRFRVTHAGGRSAAGLVGAPQG